MMDLRETDQDELLLSENRSKGGERWRKLVGYASLVGIVVMWIAQAEVAQYIQTKRDFNKPYLVVWINHGMMALLLPVQALMYRFTKDPAAPSGWLNFISIKYGLTLKKLWWAGTWLCFVYLAADYLWYVALPLTSVAAATAIFNSSCVFAYLFSMCLLGEKFIPAKVVALLAAVGGIVCVALSPGDNNANEDDITPAKQLAGNVVVTGCAVLYALYEVLFKKYAVKDITDPGVVNTFGAFVGLANLAYCWIGIIILHFLPTGNGNYAEVFVIPDGKTCGWLILNATMAVMFNMSFMLAIALTSPLIASFAIVVTIPLSGVVDYFLHSNDFTTLSIIGGALIIVGFVILTWADNKYGGLPHKDIENPPTSEGDAAYPEATLEFDPFHPASIESSPVPGRSPMNG